MSKPFKGGGYAKQLDSFGEGKSAPPWNRSSTVTWGDLERVFGAEFLADAMSKDGPGTPVTAVTSDTRIADLERKIIELEKKQAG